MSEAENITGVAVVAKPWLKWVTQGLGGGTAIAVGLAAIQAVENRPEFLPQLLGGNTLLFSALLVAMFLGDRRLREGHGIALRNVVANEQLAAGVNALVAKDDVRAETMEAAMRFVAAAQADLQRASNSIMEELAEIKSRLD